MAVPLYQVQPYDSTRRTAIMADLMRDEGRAQANATLQAGNASAQMWSNIGNTAARTLGELAEYQAEAPARELHDAQREAAKRDLDENQQIREALKLTRDPETGQLDVRAAAREVSTIDPVKGLAWWQMASDQDKADLAAKKAQLGELAQVAGALRITLDRTPPPMRPQKYAEARAAVLASHPDLEIPEQYDPAWLEQTHLQMLSVSDQLSQLEDIGKQEGFTLSPGQARFDAAGNQVAALPGAGPESGTFEGFVGSLEQEKGAPLTRGEVLEARRQWNDAGRAPERPRSTTLSPYMESNILNRLSTQWTKAVAPVAELSRQSGLMDVGMEAAKRGDLAQGSQAVLVTFQKILDPTSVVRESEYARSSAGQSLLNRVQGAAEQLAKGGAGITLEELEKFAALAKEAVDKQSSGYIDAVQARIGRTADHYGIPRDLVFEDYDFSPDAPGGNRSSGASQAPTGQGGVTVQTPDGQRFTFPDQAAADAFKKRVGIP